MREKTWSVCDRMRRAWLSFTQFNKPRFCDFLGGRVRLAGEKEGWGSLWDVVGGKRGVLKNKKVVAGHCARATKGEIRSHVPLCALS